MFDKSIKLPRDYFRKSKREYSDWRFSWWREAVQNSIDAEAKNIKLGIQETSEGLVLSCSDDGLGMSKDTLINVFLSMGGSNKTDEHCGSFGYAKVLLAYGNLNYVVETGKHRIVGAGGEYRYEELDTPVVGTTLRTTLFDEYGVRFDVFEGRLLDFLSKSDFNSVNFYLNGEKIEQEKKVKYKYEVETELGTVSFSESSNYHSMLHVRMRGICMFTETVCHYNGESAFEGVVDLSLPSREVLTSNRDGLLGGYSHTLNVIFSKLSTDRSALKSNDLVSIKLNESSNQISLSKPILNPRDSIFNNGTDDHQELDGTEFSGIDGTVGNKDIFSKIRSEVGNLREKVSDRFSKINSEAYPSNMVIKAHELDNTDGKLRQRYFAIARELELKRNKRIAWLWSGLINNILETEWANSIGINEDSEVKYYRGSPVTTGFLLSDSADAVCISGNSEIQLLLAVLNLPDDWLFEDLIDIAIHEVTHIVVASHNEDFTSEEMRVRRSFRRHIAGRNLEKELICQARRNGA